MRDHGGAHAVDDVDPVTEPIVPAATTRDQQSRAQQSQTQQVQPEQAQPEQPRSGEARPGLAAAIRVNLAFILVLLTGLVAMVRVIEYHWRQGAALIGGALLLAAVLRAVLPTSKAGLLAVRGRPVDVLSYAALGACVLFFALTIQGGPFG